jgi:Phosphatidylinositol-4-phosphate 5-Kinase
MDYSLLIGIHDLAKGNSENIRGTTLSIYQPKVPISRIPLKKGKEGDQLQLKRLATNLPNEEFLERKLGYFTSEDGGLSATNSQDESSGDYIYYFGVIDLLTTVNPKRLPFPWGFLLMAVWTKETSRDIFQRIFIPEGSIIRRSTGSIRRPLRQIHSNQRPTQRRTHAKGRSSSHRNPGGITYADPID